MDGKRTEFTWDEKLGDTDLDGNELYKSVRRGAEVFSLYDNVLTTPTADSTFPLAKIMKLWEDESGQQMVIRWFYNLKDAKAVGYEGNKIPKHEMFLAVGDTGDNGVEDSNPLEIIERKATVLNLSRDPRNPQPSKDDIEHADRVFQYALNMLNLEQCVPIEKALSEIPADALFNKREWLKSVAGKAIQEGTNNGYALLEGEVRGEEGGERKKLKKLLHQIPEDGVERGGSREKKGVPGGVQKTGVKLGDGNPSRGLKRRREGASLLLKAKVSATGGTGREGERGNGGDFFGKVSTVSLPYLGRGTNGGIKPARQSAEGTKSLPRESSIGEKPLIETDTREGDEEDTDGVKTSISLRRSQSSPSGRVSDVALAPPRAPSMDGKKRVVVNKVRPSSLKGESRLGGMDARKVVPVGARGRVQGRVKEAADAVRLPQASSKECANRASKQPVASLDRGCEPTNALTPAWTPLELQLLEVLASTDRDMGHVSALAARALKLANEDRGTNAIDDGMPRIESVGVRSEAVAALQLEPHSDSGRPEAPTSRAEAVEPTLRSAATKKKVLKMSWGSPSERDVGAKKVALRLQSLGVVPSCDIQQGANATQAQVPPLVEHDECGNNTNRLVSDTRMEEEEEKKRGGVLVGHVELKGGQPPSIFKYTWEETIQQGIYKNSIVMMENLELDVTSKELEASLKEVFPGLKGVQVCRQEHIVVSRTGSALCVFVSHEEAMAAMDTIMDNILMLRENGRPVVASLATLPTENEDAKFHGHVDIRNYNLSDRMSADESAVSTAHAAQSNTIEHPMAMEWRKLQIHQEKELEALFKAHAKAEEMFGCAKQVSLMIK